MPLLWNYYRYKYIIYFFKTNKYAVFFRFRTCLEAQISAGFIDPKGFECKFHAVESHTQ